MIKKIAVLVFTCLFAMTSMTGCISYWNGHSYNESKQLVEDALEKKYGEEFVVVDIGTRSGGSYYSPGYLTATCHPKDDDTLYFEAEYFEHGSGRELNDLYIQEKIAREIKTIINSVLSKYYNKYAVEVAISGFANNYDSKLTDAESVTIESFSKVMTKVGKSMYCDSWIVLEKSNIEIYNEQELENILQEITEQLYYMNIFFEFCYVDNDILTESIEIVQDERNNSRDIEKIIELKHKEFGYHFNGEENTLTKYEPRVG